MTTTDLLQYFLILVMFTGTGCISVSSIQTARTMNEGKTSVYGAATGTRNISTEETDLSRLEIQIKDEAILR